MREGQAHVPGEILPGLVIQRRCADRRGVVTLMLLLASMGCTTLPRTAAHHSEGVPGGPASRIYVVRRGWHIDVGFAALDLTPPLAVTLDQLPGAKFVFFGFGDRRYLEARKRGPGLNAPALLAALWPGRALVLVTALTASPGAAFGDDNVIVLPARPEDLRRAQNLVWASLTPGSATAVSPADRGPYPGSLYLESSRRYSALHTCNTWAAEVLEAAGFPVHSATVLFAGQLWSRIQAYRDLNYKAVWSRPGKPPWSPNPSAPPRWCSSPGVVDCCC